MSDTRLFPRGCVASPHHLASAAGQRVLADGGNAVDAAVAANLVLSVVTPYHCGIGGDLLALVWDGAANGVHSIGAAPAGATPEAIRSAIANGHGDPALHLPGTDMPTFGALPVTVPGATAGWFHLLERWGSRSFGELAAPAHRLAADGFVVSPHAAAHVEAARPRLAAQPGWAEHFGTMRAGQRFVQPELAGTLAAVAEHGPSVVYGGPIGERIVDVLRRHGSTMSLDDLAAHRVTEVAPLRGRYRDAEVLELPPPTQGVTALTALAILEELGGLPDDPGRAAHLRVEAVRLALADRQEHLAAPAAMRVSAQQLLDPSRVARLAGGLDPERTAPRPPGRPAPGGTAYLCAADDQGLLVSLIQSNFVGFGSGVVVPGAGIGLHDRGAYFGLDPDDVAVISPGALPMHTLIPALALRDGAPWLVFGTMGADGQPQIHVQLLGQLLDEGLGLQEAVTAARWIVALTDGAVEVESRCPARVVDGLRACGHRVRTIGAYDHRAGHAHAIEVLAEGYAGASDPRSEGAVVGT